MDLVSIASQYVGVKEVGGDNQGPQVSLFQSAVDGKAQGESWCMGFVFYCIKELETKVPTLKSNLFMSEHCLTVWNKTPVAQRLKEPEVGCIVIWQFENSSSGHTGIVTKVTKAQIETIEGNTGDGAEVNRNGDGVYKRTRLKAGSKKMKIVGYLKVF